MTSIVTIVEKLVIHLQIVPTMFKKFTEQKESDGAERGEGAVEVMKHMEEDEGEEKKKLEAIKLDLHEKEERKTNDELQDARKELVKVFCDESWENRKKEMAKCTKIRNAEKKQE
ncbi:protein INVOLVED IN DE NOVO 2-like isoform X2 [Arachis duranensis]|nr:protein INVOLVED IN DE NOVO 2-like isoform X2 [Arachis duranensis]